MSGEKKRLEQFLLQSRASRSTLSNIIQVDPRFSSFQPVQIDTIRLRAAQKEAGKQPVSEKLIKEQKKKKKKARRPKQLRGEVGRAIREQKRFERGERRDRPEEEPRIVGEPRNTGLSYDPDIERRRLDIQERQIAAANVRSLADRRAAAAAQERELAVRRGELAAGRAERRAAREAAARPAAPVALPDIRVEGARIEGPLVAGPLVAPEVADPIPEIIRLGDRIRGDYDAFGAQQDAKNRQILTDVRSLIDRQEARDEARVREARETKLREEAELRQKLARQDARYQSVEERLGAQELSMSQARDSVIQEIRDAEQRLKTSQKELDQPTGYDDVILRAVEEESQTEPTGTGSGSLRQSRFEEVTPSPSVARPPTPVTPVEEGTQPEPEGPEALLQSQTLGGDVIEGGGVLDLPSVTIPEARLSTEHDLTLSPVSDQARTYPRGTGGTGPTRGGTGALRLDTEETRAQRAARTTPVREPLIESPVATPRTAAETPSTREEEELLEEVRQVTGETSQQSMGEEFLPGSFVGQSGVSEASGVSEEPLRPVSERIEEIERVIEPAGVQAETQLRPLDPDVLFEAFEEAEEVGQVQDQRAQRIRDSQTTYQDSFPELSGEVRTGPRGKRGQRGGLGYRVRNNTDKPLKKIQPGDVVNIIGVEEGEAGEGRYRFDTQTAAGTRVSTDQLGPLIDDGSLIFEKGHRHELGGHFDENPYGPLTAQGAASQVEQAEQEEEEEEPEP